MRIRLQADGQHGSFDEGLGRFTDDETVPCFRCGVCCQRWQPLVGIAEAERLAAHLNLSRGAFLSQCARPYPFAEETYQLNERDGGCIFLAWQDGRALCSVHEARPQACRDWDASLARKECLTGLRSLTAGHGTLSTLVLYDDPADARAFAVHLRERAAQQGAWPGDGRAAPR